MAYLEDIFVTEGVPEKTFVEPPNFTALLVDIRKDGKPVIVEGQSGTGKTTAVKKALAQIKSTNEVKFLTPRQESHLPIISDISLKSGNQVFIIDDFHRLDTPTKDRLANLAKLIAEMEDRSGVPKLVVIGINKVGSDLIQLVPDIAKRVGIHRIQPGTVATIEKMIVTGATELNIEIADISKIYAETKGDYWLTQQFCKTICVLKRVHQTEDTKKTLHWEGSEVRKSVLVALSSSYDPNIKEFCRGTRFRPTNDPYFKLLKAVSEQHKSNVDLTEIANSNPDIRGSINNVKDERLSTLLANKPNCANLFYYDPSTKNFAIEDPALFFYLQNLDWDVLREECGFKEIETDFEFDFAISFAGENRELAECIVKNLKILDFGVFYDRLYEDNYLGEAWGEHFNETFVKKSRFVIAILDKHHNEKVWPTFERDCFAPRVKEKAIIPVKLDDTVFVGIPSDLVAINFEWNGSVDDSEEEIIDKIVMRIAKKLDQ